MFQWIENLKIKFKNSIYTPPRAGEDADDRACRQEKENRIKEFDKTLKNEFHSEKIHKMKAALGKGHFLTAIHDGMAKYNKAAQITKHNQRQNNNTGREYF